MANAVEYKQTVLVCQYCQHRCNNTLEKNGDTGFCDAHEFYVARKDARANSCPSFKKRAKLKLDT